MKKFIENNNIKIENGLISYIDFDTRKEITKPFIIDINKIHNKFKTFNYQKEYESYGKIKDEAIERFQMLPFAYVYYYYIAKNLDVPSPREFVNEYFNLFCKKADNNKYTFKEEYLISDKNIIFDKAALAARILRSYNSFNREIEFLINFINTFKDVNIIYNLETDLFSGVDLKVEYNKKTFGMAEYVFTNRSKQFKEKKNTNRHDYSAIKMIDVIANFSYPDKNVTKYGQIFCYDNNTLKNVYKQIVS